MMTQAGDNLLLSILCVSIGLPGNVETHFEIACHERLREKQYDCHGHRINYIIMAGNQEGRISMGCAGAFTPWHSSHCIADWI
jgi:hypothetical protein